MTDRSILVVVHQAHSTPAKIGTSLEARGYALDRRCPCQGDALPADLSPYTAAVVFGGPQSANDDDVPGIRAELDWLERTALASGKPLLGICLGAQQIARVLGARVGRHPEGLVEIGYYEVAPTGRADDFLDGPTVFYQWHSETFTIPETAVHLAENERFEGQAFRYDGHVYGIEFHPEMTLELIQRWCESERGKPKLSWPGAQPRDAHLDGYALHAAGSDRWLERFLDGWLPAAAGVRSRGA